jgi:hypothetical protein
VVVAVVRLTPVRAVEALLDLPQRLARQDERVAAEDVVDVQPLRRQHVDERQVARGQAEVRVDLRPGDDQHGAEAELVEGQLEELRLALLEARLVEDHQLAIDDLARQGALEAEHPDLARQREAVVARVGAEGDAAAAEDVAPPRAVAGAPGPLLLVELRTGACDLGPGLHLAGAGPALRELPQDHTVEDVAPHLDAVDRVVELDRAHLLGGEVSDR